MDSHCFRHTALHLVYSALIVCDGTHTTGINVLWSHYHLNASHCLLCHRSVVPLPLSLVPSLFGSSDQISIARIFWRRTLIFMPSMPSQCPYIYRDPVITAAPALLLKQNDWSFIPYPINTSLRSEEHVSLGSAGPGPIRRVITRGRRKPYTLVAPGTLTPPPTSPLSPLSTSSSLTAIGVTDAELVVPVHRPAGTHGKHYNVATELTSNAPTWTMSKFNDLKVRLLES